MRNINLKGLVPLVPVAAVFALALLLSWPSSSRATLTVSNTGLQGDTNITLDTNGTLGIGTASATAITIGQSGLNVSLQGGLTVASATGIGTTTPSSSLFVQGGGNINPFNVASSTGASELYVATNGNVGIGTSTPPQPLTVVGNTYLNGLLGIGTSNPQSKVDVEFNGGGGIFLESFRNAGLGANIELLHSRGTQASPLPANVGDAGGHLYFDVIDASTTQDEIVGDIGAVYTGDNGTSKTWGALTFSVDSTPDQAMIIATYPNSQNPVVGIDTGNPAYILDVDPNGSGSDLMRVGDAGLNKPNYALVVADSGSVAVNSSTPVADFQVADKSSNTTTTIEFGKSGQNKGTCLKLYRSDGSAVYASVAAGATTFTLSTTPCASVTGF